MWQALLCTHAWAFVVKVGILWMFTEWIKGLMGYEAKSFVWIQWSVKHKNIPTLGILPTPAHPVTGLWALLTGAPEWALAWAQLWTDQHWKHTHVHMHHTKRDLFHCPFHIQQCKWPGSGLWTSVPLQGKISTSFSYHCSGQRGKKPGSQWLAKTYKWLRGSSVYLAFM